MASASPPGSIRTTRMCRTSCAPSPAWRPTCSISPVTPAISTGASASPSARHRLVMTRPGPATRERARMASRRPGRHDGAAARRQCPRGSSRPPRLAPHPSRRWRSAPSGPAHVPAWPSGDWAGAARSAGRALGLLSELTGETGPDTIEDWLSPHPGPGRHGSLRPGAAGRRARRGPALRARRRHDRRPYRCQRPSGRPGPVLAAASLRCPPARLSSSLRSPRSARSPWSPDPARPRSAWTCPP